MNTKMYYYLKRAFEELPFSPKTTGLGVATAFTTLMLLVTSIASAQGEPNQPVLLNNYPNQRQATSIGDGTEITPNSYSNKTQLETTETKTKKSTQQYEVKKNETVPSIAKQFNISQNTVRWANDIDGNSVEAGTKLKILPVSGFEYKIREGDSAKSLADDFSTDAATIITFNEITFTGFEKDGFRDGKTIIIPDGVNPPPKPIVISFRAASMNDPSGHNTVTIVRSNTPTYSGNAYPWGNCTWYVSNRRAELNRPIPNKLGNARSWAYSAASRGIKVDHKPSIGAVFAESGQNHVAVVERINPDGSITISEMNYNWRLGVKSMRTIPAGSVSRHSYIH